MNATLSETSDVVKLNDLNSTTAANTTGVKPAFDASKGFYLF